jgi:hypothetical protein
MGVQTVLAERNPLNATAARRRRRTSPRHQPLPRHLQGELEQARLDRDRAVVSIRGTFVQRQQELDRERRREERLAWDRFRTREAEIRGRASASPDLLKTITRSEHSPHRPSPDLPLVATRPLVDAAAARAIAEHVDLLAERLNHPPPAPRRRWWHRLVFWRRP